MSSFSDIGILVDELKDGNQKTTCPKCSESRTKKNDPCLSVNVTEGVFLCHHCEWKGSIKKINHSSSSPNKKTIVAKYDYREESGKMLCQSVRFVPKSFSYRRPDGNGGWLWNLDNVRRVPYRLPELIASEGTVYIPGGEKDVETLVTHSLTATTNSCGEGNWKPEFKTYLKDRDVIILEDNDWKGQKHGKVISESLIGTAKTIKIIRFSELPKGGDVSDYLVDHTIKDFQEKVETSPLFTGSYHEYFGNKEDEEKKSPSQILIEIASQCEFFHSPDQECYATFRVDDHFENWRIRSKGFKRWLTGKFYSETRKAPSGQAFNDALGVLECKAHYEGKNHPIHVRVGSVDEKIYLDLCNDEWEAVEIDGDGWRFIKDLPVKFVRSKGMLPLPKPKKGSSLELLRPFLNLPDEDSWCLFVADLVGSLRDRGPYPILITQGEQGSAKSTLSRIKRSLIDPNSAPLRTTPREERDLMIAARNGWVLSFDNLSGLSNKLSDALCRLSTGGGFGCRQLYSDSEEELFDAQRPVCLNGIDEIGTRGDLRDRAIILHLPIIDENKRRDEKTFWENFEEVKPGILGSLLTTVSSAIKNLPDVKREQLPRMADFARWVVAAEPALAWEPGSFLKAYTKNRMLAAESGVEGSLVGQAIIDLVQPLTETWEGNATELLEELIQQFGEGKAIPKTWPKTPRSLSNSIKRLAPALRLVGVEVNFKRAPHSGKRLILLNNVARPSSPSSPKTPADSNLFDFNELKGDARLENSDHCVTASSPDNPLKKKPSDEGDEGDDKKHPISTPDDPCWEASL